MRLDTVILEESHDHQLTTESFVQLLDKDLKPKWDSFSDKTKENIWDYFQYLRGLVEIHDTDNYDSWVYWHVVMTKFVRGFDESHPYYDGNFEKVVLSESSATLSSCSGSVSMKLKSRKTRKRKAAGSMVLSAANQRLVFKGEKAMIGNIISTNENLVQVFCGVRGYEKDGVAYLHIEDVARGLGFERTELKNGVEYTSIRWATVEGYLTELGFRQQVGENGKPHDYYIPENIFYRLCMKAKNEVAEKFQTKVADDIIPSIRKTGSYSVNQAQQQSMMCLPQDYESALESLLTEVRKNKALQAELTSEKEAHEKDNEDFKTGLDILNAQKAQIGSRREATAMATASSARAHQHFAEKVLETHAGELIALRAAVDEQRSHLWDANRTALEIYRLNVLKKEYSLNTLQNKARELLSHFATKLMKRPIPLPNGATYTDSFGRLQPSISTYYESDVVDAVLDWVVEHPNDFARIGGKRDPLNDEW